MDVRPCSRSALSDGVPALLITADTDRDPAVAGPRIHIADRPAPIADRHACAADTHAVPATPYAHGTDPHADAHCYTNRDSDASISDRTGQRSCGPSPGLRLQLPLERGSRCYQPRH